MKTHFRNYKGEMIAAPKDFKTVVAKHDDGTIVWSRCGLGRHRVRYALQVKEFSLFVDAASHYGCCVGHLAECNGQL